MLWSPQSLRNAFLISFKKCAWGDNSSRAKSFSSSRANYLFYPCKQMLFLLSHKRWKWKNHCIHRHSSAHFQVNSSHFEYLNESNWMILRVVCPKWGAIQKWPLIRPCQTKVTSTIRPSQTKVSSDQTKVRSKHRVHSKCARNWLWSDHSRPKGPLIRPTSDHCPDNCALKITSDQTILRLIVTPDQTIVRSKSPLIRLNCAQNSLISDWFSLWTKIAII